MDKVGLNRKLMNVVMIALFSLIPVVFHPFINDPFALPKVTVLRIMVVLLLVLLIIKYVLEKRIVWSKSVLNKPVLLFLAAIVASTVFSVYRNKSIWGIHGFYFEGLMSFLAYGVIYFIAANSFADNRKVLRGIVYVSVIVSVYAVLQSLGITFFVWKGTSPYPRVWSTMGNPNFLSALTVMFIPICLVHLMNSKGIAGKIAYSVIFLLNLLALVFTYSRAAWVGMAAGMIAFVFMVDKKTLKKNLAYLLVVLFTGSVLVALWPAGSGRAGEKKTSLKPVVRRAVSTMDLEENDIASRLSGWKTAVKMISKRPVLGFGPDTFASNFRRFMSKEYEELAGRFRTAGYAHNDFLQYGATFGLLGLGAFIFLLLVFFRSLVKISRNKDNNLVAAGLFASSVALLVNNQFSFSSLVPAVLFWFFMGLCSSLLGGEARERKLHIEKNNRVFIIVLVVMLAGLLCFSSVKWLVASRYDRIAQNAMADGKLGDAIFLQEKSVSLNPFQDLYRMRLAKFYQQMVMYGKSIDEKDRAFKKSKQGYMKQVKKFKYNSLAYNGLGVTSMYGAEFLGKEECMLESIKYFSKAIEYDPYFIEAHSNMAAVYYETGRKDEAIKMYKEIIEMKPEVTLNYYNLGVLYANEADYGSAIRYLQKALRLDPGFKECEEALVQIWQEMEGGIR